MRIAPTLDTGAPTDSPPIKNDAPKTIPRGARETNTNAPNICHNVRWASSVYSRKRMFMLLVLEEGKMDHCYFCDSPVDERDPRGRATCHSHLLYGPDFTFSLTDDNGCEWKVIVYDETDIGSILFVTIKALGATWCNSAVEIDGNMPTFEWKYNGSSYDEFKRIQAMMDRICQVLRAECEEQGIWNDFVQAYAEAKRRHEEDDLEDLTEEIRDFVSEEIVQYGRGKVRKALLAVLDDLGKE